jgi:hypothetical protein
METNFELYVGVVHAAGAGTAPAQRLNAALNLTRAPEARTLRPRLAPDRAPAAESPAERPRGGAKPQRSRTK